MDASPLSYGVGVVQAGATPVNALVQEAGDRQPAHVQNAFSWPVHSLAQPCTATRGGAGQLTEAVAPVELQLAYDQMVGIVGRLDAEAPVARRDPREAEVIPLGIHRPQLARILRRATREVHEVSIYFFCPFACALTPETKARKLLERLCIPRSR